MQSEVDRLRSVIQDSERRHWHYRKECERLASVIQRARARIAADGVAQREDRIRDLERALAAAREAAERWRVHAATAELALAAKSAELEELRAAVKVDRVMEQEDRKALAELVGLREERAALERQCRDAEELRDATALAYEDACGRSHGHEFDAARLRAVIERTQASLQDELRAGRDRASPALAARWNLARSVLAILSEADAPPQAEPASDDMDYRRRYGHTEQELAHPRPEAPPSSEAAGATHSASDPSVHTEAAGAETVRAMRAKRTNEDAEIVLRAIGRLHVDDQPDQAQCPVCSLLHDYWSGRALPTMEQAMSARREDVETTREAEIVKEESP